MCRRKKPRLTLKMGDTFLMALDEIQPSQLFISAEKLRRVTKAFDQSRLETLQPIPVKELEDQVIFTDGHTRALAAHLHGLREVRAFWDEDELDWEAYRVCVGWCKDAGIHTIADLGDRIVDREKYEMLWLRRCKRMHQDLEMRRGQR